MSISFIRQMDVINPALFEHEINVIGAGATGSWAVLFLAKMGFKIINVWDFDEVEDHNLPNQAFQLKSVGKSKAEEIKRIVDTASDVEINVFNEAFEGGDTVNGVVFVLTDTMKSRSEIWMESLKYNPNVKLVIETRMDYNGGRVYTVDPMNMTHIQKYEETLYTDEEATTAGPSACGATATIVTTAVDIVSHAIWNMINWFNDEQYYNELLLDMQYKNILTREFKED